MLARCALVCLGLFALGCVHPSLASAPAPDHAAPTPVVFGEHDNAIEPLEPDGLPGIEPGECPATLADSPTSFFGDHVRIRLPLGVDTSNFVEFTPGVFARSARAIASSHCRADLPPATIEFMALVQFDDQPRDRVTTMRDEVLDAFAYPSQRVIVAEEVEPRVRGGRWVVELPPGPERPEPAKLLVAMVAVRGSMTALVYEVHVDAWPLLVDSLVASAAQMVVVPH